MPHSASFVRAQHPLRVLLAGYGEHGLRVLQGLLQLKKGHSGIEWLGAMSWSSANKQSGWQTQPDEARLNQFIRSHQGDLTAVPACLFNSKAWHNVVTSYEPNLVLCATWGEIISTSTLTHYSDILFINCHPALLPHHRGANPYTSAIRSGDTHSGVTFHVVTPAIDGGPILWQQNVPIDPADTGGSLKSRCALAARDALPRLFELLSTDGPISVQPQSDKGSYYPPITMTDGALDWRHSADDLINQVRGLNPWLDGYTRLERRILGWQPFWITDHIQPPSQDVLRMHDAPPGTVLRSSTQGLVIACGQTEAVEIPRYQLHTALGFLPHRLSSELGARLFRQGDRMTLPSEVSEQTAQLS